MIIAIDGPGGSGKSSISKIIAKDLEFIHLDTGSMFRAITNYCISNDVNLNVETDVEKCLDKINLTFDGVSFKLNNHILGDEIRTKIINNNVSLIASYPVVRQYTLKLQRDIASNFDTILDGRDIGSVVFPNADVKIYLDASIKQRAKRRYEEVYLDSNSQTLEEIEIDISKRDEFDKNRKIAPLIVAKDATVIDTTKMSIDEVVDKIKSLVKKVK